MNTQHPATTPVHYVVWESRPGGAELSVNHYIDRFHGRRKVHVYSLRGAANEIYDDAKITFQNGGTYGHWACYTRYFRYCRTHRRDVFHLLSIGPLMLLLTLLAGVRRPVYHIHGTIYWKKPLQRIYLKAAWLLCGLFPVTFVANSKYSAGIFREKVLPVQPHVLYNGFEVARFFDKRRLRTAPRRMAFTGRLQPGKNADLVLRLFEDVAGRFPGMELHIAGDGALRPGLEAKAQNSPFRNRIFFHGWLQDLPAFYESVDLFLFLSAYESFGNVVAEGFLTGLPVLTSTVPVFGEIHGNDPDFVLGDPGNYPLLKQNLEKALADFPARAQKAYALAERLKADFNIENHLTEIERIYEKTESTGHLLPLRGAEAV